jgi:hypothetical protein
MPVARIPLVGSYNQRSIDAAAALAAGQDQRFLNCVFSVVKNPVTGNNKIYAEKRPGWGVDSIVAAGSVSTALIKTDSFGSVVSAFGDTNSTVYDGGNSVGAITGRALFMSEMLISGVGYVVIKSSDGTGWYYTSDALTQTAYSGNTTNGSAVVTNIASTAGMYSGQALSGTGITAGTRILTVDSSTQITMNANATATNAGVAITKTPIAKILSANFVTTGTTVTAFVDMDGFLFYANADGYVYNGDLNAVATYSASNKLAVQLAPDPPNAIARQKNVIAVWGISSMEVFYNAGNASGSPLSRSAQASSRIGALDQRSVCSLADDIYFVTSAKYGDVSVMRMRNLDVQQISTPAINKTLGTVVGNGGYVYLSAFQMGGQSYVSAFVTNATEITDFLLLESGDQVLLETGDLVILEANLSSDSAFAKLLVYNIALDLWSEWDSGEATYIVGIGSGSVNQVIASSRISTSGKIYTIKPSSYGELHTDDGSTFTTEVRTSKLDFDTDRRKFVKSVGLVADEESTGTVTLEASDDDYATWFTLGTFDLTAKKKRIYRCGSHRGGRAYRLRHSSDGAFRAEALEIDYEVAKTT